MTLGLCATMPSKEHVLDNPGMYCALAQFWSLNIVSALWFGALQQWVWCSPVCGVRPLHQVWHSSGTAGMIQWYSRIVWHRQIRLLTLVQWYSWHCSQWYRWYGTARWCCGTVAQWYRRYGTARYTWQDNWFLLQLVAELMTSLALGYNVLAWSLLH